MKTFRGKLQLLRSKWRGGKEGHLREYGRMVTYASTDAFRGNGARTLINEMCERSLSATFSKNVVIVTEDARYSIK